MSSCNKIDEYVKKHPNCCDVTFDENGEIMFMANAKILLDKGKLISITRIE